MLDKIVVADLLSRSCVLTDLVAKDKLEVIEKMTDCLYSEQVITNKTGFINDVLAREELGSTGFENQIAIPHGKSPWVKETRIAVAKLSKPVDWETMDSSDVKLVILFAVKDADSGAGHIRVLAKISIALGDDDTVDKLINSQTKEELYDLIVNHSEE
jgi:fructose PTS system EIIA component